MRSRTWLVASILFLLAAATQAAQAATEQIPQGGKTVTWDADCNGSKTFSNNTGRPICDFRIEVVGGGNVLPRNILVEDGIGNWTVDDNQDGDVGDPGEDDDIDSTPSTPARVQRDPGNGRPAGRCIPDGGSFGINLCGDDTTTPNPDNADMSGKQIKLVPTAESGKDIVGIATLDGTQVVVLANETAALNPFLGYSARALNTGECIDSVRVTPLDPGVKLTELTTDWPGHLLDDTTVVFEEPLPPGKALTIDFAVAELAEGETTSFRVDPPISADGSAVSSVTFPNPIGSDHLVFQGKVLQVGTAQGVWSGLIPTSQWVRYQVLSVSQGTYGGSSITVHHTIINGSPDMDPSGQPQLDPVVFTPSNVVWIEADLTKFPYDPNAGLYVYDGARVRTTDGSACLLGLIQQVDVLCLEQPDALSLRAAGRVATDLLAEKDPVGATAGLDTFEAELLRLLESGDVRDRAQAMRLQQGIHLCRVTLAEHSR